MSRSISGCEPTRPPQNQAEALHAYLKELRDLGPEDYREIAVPLLAALTTSTVTGSDKFRAPSTHNFAITEIRGHILLRDLSTESQAVSAVGNPSFPDRVAIKASNCRLALQNTDRTQKIFETSAQLSIGTFVEFAGGRPMVFDRPQILPAGENVQVDFTLVDTASDVVGGTTEYGIILIGALVRVKNS